MGRIENTSEYEKVPTKELINENDKSNVPSYGYGIRHVQIVILFTCMTIGYIARAHLGVSIVAMTNTIARTENAVNVTNNDNFSLNGTELIDINGTDLIDINRNDLVKITGTNLIDVNGTGEIDFNGYGNGTNVESESDVTFPEDSIWNVYRTYDWGKSTQDTILGAFFIGYCIAMFPTGLICQRFGGKLPLQSCLLINGVVSLVTPSVAVWGSWKAVFCCRVLQGMSQAGLYPSAHALLAKWVPISERATLASFVYTGTLIGTVLAFQIGGAMVTTAAGWPGTFWLTGGLCLASFLMLTIFGAASPADHKTITKNEKNYILGEIDDGTKKKAAKAPWKRILVSRPLWSTFANHISSGICFVFFFTQIPSYMHYILGFDVKNSGLLSSLPYAASAVANMGFGFFSDFVINRGLLSMRNARIVCNSFAHFGPAVCLILMCLTNNSGVAVFLLIIALALYAGMHSGWMVNYMDLSPNFSGSLMAMGNTWATICVNFLPVLMSNVVIDVYDRHQWQIVMFIMAAMLSISNAFFIFFMSADKQPWDQIDEQDDVEKKQSMELTENNKS